MTSHGFPDHGASTPFTQTLSSGHTIPTLGLGTWKSAPGEVRDAVYAALKIGYRHIDCAAFYFNEHEVGEGLARAIADGICRREDVFLTGKLWVACFNDVEEWANKTVADLGCGYLDLYLIHWPYELVKGTTEFPPPLEARIGYTPERIEAVWRRMEALVDAGLLRSIGVSNFTSRKLRALHAVARIKPAVNQVESHPYLPQRKLGATCRELGVLLQAYSPLGSPDRSAAIRDADEPNVLATPEIVAIAQAHSVSPAQVLLRWQAQRGVNVVAKSVNAGRIADNFAITALVLSADDMATLDRIPELHGGINRCLRAPWFCVRPEMTYHDLFDSDTE